MRQKLTYMVDELPDHPVPLPLVVLGTVLPVCHQSDLVGEAQDVGELLQEVQAVTLEAVVPTQLLVRLFVHHIWIFLHSEKKRSYVLLLLMVSVTVAPPPPPLARPQHPLLSILAHQDGGDNQSPVSQRVSHVVILVSVGLRQVHASERVPHCNLERPKKERQRKRLELLDSLSQICRRSEHFGPLE